MGGELTLGRVRATPGFLLGVALLLFLDEGQGLLWVFGLAGVCHELGHLLAAWGLRLRLRYLRLSLFGAELALEGRGRRLWWGEALLAAAGPGVNLALAGLCCRLGAWPVFAGANLLLAGFNLLPVPPLDGGRVLSALAARFLPGGWGLGLSDLVAGLTRGVVLGLGLVLAAEGNWSLLVLGVWLLGAG